MWQQCCDVIVFRIFIFVHFSKVILTAELGIVWPQLLAFQLYVFITIKFLVKLVEVVDNNMIAEKNFNF